MKFDVEKWCVVLVTHPITSDSSTPKADLHSTTKPSAGHNRYYDLPVHYILVKSTFILTEFGILFSIDVYLLK